MGLRTAKLAWPSQEGEPLGDCRGWGRVCVCIYPQCDLLLLPLLTYDLLLTMYYTYNLPPTMHNTYYLLYL
jgi:hypothetical protein